MTKAEVEPEKKLEHAVAQPEYRQKLAVFGGIHSFTISRSRGWSLLCLPSLLYRLSSPPQLGINYSNLGLHVRRT